LSLYPNNLRNAFKEANRSQLPVIFSASIKHVFTDLSAELTQTVGGKLRILWYWCRGCNFVLPRTGSIL